MDETKILGNMLLEFELSHISSNRIFQLPPDASVLRIGKPSDLFRPEIDASNLPNSEIVSRQHAEIRIEDGNYYLVDVGSSNGTYLNGEKLVVGNLYQLNSGDRITLGMGEEVGFIFQPTTLPSQQVSSSQQTALQTQPYTSSVQVASAKSTGNRPTKIIGLVLIAIAVIMIAANTRIGIFVRIPGLILCAAGGILQFQHRINKNIGWILIGLGVLIILTGNVFASANLLAIMIAAALLFAGHQLFTTGKILNRSPEEIGNTLKGVLRGKEISNK